MAEILATMRRIIAEDEHAAAAPPAASRAEDEHAATPTAASIAEKQHAAVPPVASIAEEQHAAAAPPVAIITEEQHAAAAPPVASNDREDAPATPTGVGVLELTEALNEDGTVRHLAPLDGTARRRDEEPAPAAAAPGDTRTEPELPAEPAPRQARDDGPRHTMAPISAEAGQEPLVSEVTSFAAAAALAQLATIPRDKGTHPSPRIGERTLEELIADLLQPLLRTWLDENLPQLVERLVQREIDRVASRSGVR